METCYDATGVDDSHRCERCIVWTWNQVYFVVDRNVQQSDVVFEEESLWARGKFGMEESMARCDTSESCRLFDRTLKISVVLKRNACWRPTERCWAISPISMRSSFMESNRGANLVLCHIWDISNNVMWSSFKRRRYIQSRIWRWMSAISIGRWAIDWTRTLLRHMLSYVMLIPAKSSHPPKSLTGCRRNLISMVSNAN